MWRLAANCIALLWLAVARPCHAADFNYFDASRAVVTIYCESSKALGGGVVLAKTSVVSVNHVVSPCQQVVIGYYDGTYALGTVTATDESRDLALIRPEYVPTSVTIAQLDIDTPTMDEQLHVISHLNAMTWTHTTAALAYPYARPISLDGQQYSLLVINTQTFAGSSGGALFNNDGRVVGIAKGMLSGTSIAYFVPGVAVCKHIINCKSK